MKKAMPVLKSLWFVLVIALVFVGRDVYFPGVVLITALALLAPLIREFQSRTNLDERQIQISHYSSRIAYFVYSALLIFVIIREWVKNGEIPSLLLFILIFAPLLAKIAICLYQNYGGVRGLAGFFNLFFRGILPSRRIDERQSVIGNLSSHVAFYVFLILTLTVVLFGYVRLGREPAPLWYMLLLVPLVSKLYASFFHTYEAAKAAQFVLYLVAGLFFLFILLSHGISLGALMESIPFWLIISLAILAAFYPRTAGAVLVLIAVGMIIFFHVWGNLDLYIRILMLSLIPIPVLLSGLGLLLNRRVITE